MLFIFEEERKASFWMKDMLIPLDMVWINKDFKVVHITKDIFPCEPDYCPSVTPPENVKYVLEVNAGVSDEIGLLVGDVLSFNID